MNKTIREILQNNYIVPLYQRNFTWEELQIHQFVQDVYYNFKNSKNYFIGSLITRKREDGSFEIIDGQQRLTLITLIAKIMEFDNIVSPCLKYDSRIEVIKFFNDYYAQDKQRYIPDSTSKIEHYVNAIDYILDAPLDPNLDNQSCLVDLKNNDIESYNRFRKHFQDNIVLIHVELPNDTNVSSYFEIMNNRGEQLRKHEILKARLIDEIKRPNGEHDRKKQLIFARIWDACSNMDTYIQKEFSRDDRIALFGYNFEGYELNLNGIELNKNNEDFEPETINNILVNKKTIGKMEKQTTDDDEDEGEYRSIIDFPNFLMHILHILYSEKYEKEYNDQNGIPLNEKFLLNDDYIKYALDEPYKFIRELLYFRIVFDRFIIKTKRIGNNEDDYEWVLLRPVRHGHGRGNRPALRYKNAFEDKDEHNKILKSMSMLQVTYRTRIYKNWLKDVLYWFINHDYWGEDYLYYLNELINKYYEKTENAIIPENNSSELYSHGTSTPHLLFNFIDYLYWMEDQGKLVDKRHYSNFEYRYWNSIEHHNPQNPGMNKKLDVNISDCLGNLCLVSKSMNSRMSSNTPLSKADYFGNKGNISPKRQIMYKITKSQKKWEKKEILDHYADLIRLIKNRKSILMLE